MMLIFRGCYAEKYLLQRAIQNFFFNPHSVTVLNGSLALPRAPQIKLLFQGQEVVLFNSFILLILEDTHQLTKP